MMNGCSTPSVASLGTGSWTKHWPVGPTRTWRSRSDSRKRSHSRSRWQMLAPRLGERILEIGTGSGYQAAVLCTLGAQLFTIERLRPLYERVRPLLRELGYRANCRLGDGTKGWEIMSPFDGIIVTAGAMDVPEPLLMQLRCPTETAPGGRLVIPVGPADNQVMHRIVRTGETEFEREEHDGFRFVPLIAD